jgi:hypothetical protein
VGASGVVQVVEVEFKPRTTKKKKKKIHMHSGKICTSQMVVSSQALVAHTCNPSYSENKDQEDNSSKPAQENSSQDRILKLPNTKTQGWWSGSRCHAGPEFKPQYCKKNQKQMAPPT